MADRIKNYQQEADQITTLKEIRTDLGVTPSSYTPDATVVTKDRVATFAQAEEELVVLSDIEKGVKQQVVKGDIADKRISNIEKLLQGNLYDYQTDSTSAYTKTVPSGAMPYAGLGKVGGKTVVLNQLQANTVSRTNAGVVFTFNSATGELTISEKTPGATRTSVAYWVASNNVKWNWFATHKDLAKQGTTQSVVGVYIPASSNVSVPTGSGGIVTVPNDTTSYLQVVVATSANISTPITIRPQIFDLTLMFGAGNEPSTVEEFEALFPASYYPYNAGTLFSAGVTEVVSKDANDSTLQTIPIPTAIRNLEGYGWSAGTAYNYVDFERKKFVQCVGKVILDGTQTLALTNWQPLTNSVGWAYSTSTTPNAKKPSTNYEVAKVLTDKLPTTRYAGVNNIFSTDASAVALSTATNYGLFVRVMDTSLTTETAINNYLSANPIEVYYELATPTEVDISAYLTDDNLIEVEAGGTLTFPNSNGSDYCIPVPSEEEYMIDLQEAINNG